MFKWLPETFLGLVCIIPKGKLWKGGGELDFLCKFNSPDIHNNYLLTKFSLCGT